MRQSKTGIANWVPTLPSHLSLQGTLSDSDLHPLPQDPQLRELAPPLPRGDPQQDPIGLETQAKPINQGKASVWSREWAIQGRTAERKSAGRLLRRQLEEKATAQRASLPPGCGRQGLLLPFRLQRNDRNH